MIILKYSSKIIFFYNLYVVQTMMKFFMTFNLRRAVLVSKEAVAEESSRPGDLLKDLPSPTPQPVKISEFDSLALSIINDTILMTAEDIALTLTEQPIIDTSAEDISMEASIEKALAVKPVLEVAGRHCSSKS